LLVSEEIVDMLESLIAERWIVAAGIFRGGQAQGNDCVIGHREVVVFKILKLDGKQWRDASTLLLRCSGELGGDSTRLRISSTF